MQRTDLLILEAACPHRLVLSWSDHTQRREVHQDHAELHSVLYALGKLALLPLQGDRLHSGDALEDGHQRLKRLLVEFLLSLLSLGSLGDLRLRLLLLLLPLLALLLLLSEACNALVPGLVHHIAELD